MAKLSARNRREMSRYQRIAFGGRTLYAFMSDGHVLSRFADAGWKDSPGYIGVGQFAAFRDRLKLQGFSLVEGRRNA